MMMELISKDKFRCFCGKSIDYDPEDILANHIETCVEYHRESPLGKVFYKINMKELEVGHLLALRSEYLKHALAINEELKFSIFFFYKMKIYGIILKQREKTKWR